jgi:hypothetical protein
LAFTTAAFPSPIIASSSVPTIVTIPSLITGPYSILLTIIVKNQHSTLIATIETKVLAESIIIKGIVRVNS